MTLIRSGQVQLAAPIAHDLSGLFPHLHDLDWTEPLVVGVSGGGDSMALLAICTAYRDILAPQAKIHAVTIHHGLRKEADHEAGLVAQWCLAHGVPHYVRYLDLPAEPGALAARAREARRAVLLDVCGSVGGRQLLLGHTLNDRLETLLMRTKRGGFRGSASISKRSFCFPGVDDEDGISIIRPLLNIKRQHLRELLLAHDIPWCDDPTNDDMRFERPRQRRVLQALGRDNCASMDQLNQYCQLMERFRHCMAQSIARWLMVHLDIDAKYGTLRFPADSLGDLPNRVSMEVLRELVRFCSGDAYMMAQKQTKAGLIWLRNTERGQMSIGRCVLKRMGSTAILQRACRNLPVIFIKPGQMAHWDNRFRVMIEPSIFAGRDSHYEVAPSEEKPLIPMVRGAECDVRMMFWPCSLNGPFPESDKPIWLAFTQLLREVPRSGASAPS